MPAHPQPASANGGHPFSRLFYCGQRALLIALWLGHCFSGTRYAAGQIPRLATLTTCFSAHYLTVADANRHHPVHLRAIVTYYEVPADEAEPTLFVLDDSGSVYVSLAAVPATPLAPGDVVEVTGVTSGGEYAPIVARARVEVRGHTSIPAVGPRIELADILSGAGDGRWVEIEAVVHSARAASGAIILSLAMRGGTIVARAPIELGVDYSKLIDAKILLRGNVAPLFNHQQQINGGIINFPGISGVRIEQPANPDPFSLAVTPMIALLGYTPDQDIPRRVHLRGRTTLFWPGRMLCLHDETDSVCAQVSQTTPIAPGDWVDVVGFPNAGEFSPTLVHSTFKSLGLNQAVSPLNLNTQQALSDLYDSELVSMEGQVIGEDPGAADPTVILSADSLVFSVVLDKNRQLKLMPPEHGSYVRVTGICSIQSDATADTSRVGFPVAKSFRLLLRSPADLVVLRKPSWWNAVHTLRVLSVALAFALFALGWVALLSRRVHQQTAVIRAQLLETAALKDAAESATVAAEFHASHDELTGTLNRRTIFAALQREFDAAACAGNSIGVIMLDLDHFKRVNDVHGHLAGDEVLRETVRRLTLAVRTSDRVGRYGGEEFLVVLPLCDRVQLEACAERMRAAISSTPMIVGEAHISMTASIGATAILPPGIAMLDALAAADSALYQAKNSGRDRVVVKEMLGEDIEASEKSKLFDTV